MRSVFTSQHRLVSARVVFASFGESRTLDSLSTVEMCPVVAAASWCGFEVRRGFTSSSRSADSNKRTSHVTLLCLTRLYVHARGSWLGFLDDLGVHMTLRSSSDLSRSRTDQISRTTTLGKPNDRCWLREYAAQVERPTVGAVRVPAASGAVPRETTGFDLRKTERGRDGPAAPGERGRPPSQSATTAREPLELGRQAGYDTGYRPGARES